MAKVEAAARITTEVAPPQFITVAKRPLTIMLATIVEEEKDFVIYESLSSSTCGSSPALHLSRLQIEKSVLLRSS